MKRIGFVLLLAIAGCDAPVESPVPPQVFLGGSSSPPFYFGKGGYVVSNPSLDGDMPFAAAVHDGFIYVAGYDGIPGNTEWRIEKRDCLEGNPDPPFGIGGAISENPSSGPDQVCALVLDAHFMYLAGFDSIPGGSNAEWRIEKRDLVDGTLDGGFGAAGVVLSNPSGGMDVPTAIAVDADWMYVTGYDSINTNRQWRIEKRSLITGLLDPTFAVGGVYSFNPSALDEEANALALTTTGSILVAGTIFVGVGDTAYRLEKISAVTGAVDPFFTTTHNPSSGLDAPFGMVLNGPEFIVVGRLAQPGSVRWKIDRRREANGMLLQDDSYHPSAGPEAAKVVILSGSDIYVAGEDITAGGRNHVQKRSAWTLSLDPNFETSGVYIEDPSAGPETVTALAQDFQALYIVSSDYTPGQSQWRIRKISK